MQKKTGLFFIFGLVTALVVATSAVLYLIDWNQYRGQLAQLVSDRLGVRVEVAGDLGLQLLPRPSLTAQAIRLAPLQAGFNDTIATADQIDMRLGLAAALTGTIELQSLALEGVSVALTETTSGWRVKGWPEAAEAPSAAADTAGNSNNAALASLDRFRLENSTIRATRLNGATIELTKINVDLSGTLPGGPVEWDGSVVVAETPLSVSGRVVPVKTRDETSIRSIINVADATIEASGRVTPDGDITGRLQAEGKSVRTLAAVAAKLTDTNLPVNLPGIPFAIDMQIDRESGITRVVSRQFSVDKTRGVVDVTIAEKNGAFHLTGTTTLGVITLGDDVFESLAAVPAQENVAQTNAGNAPPAPVTGAIDITVEGVEYRGGLVQQINAVVGFDEGTPFLSQFSALMPGASRFAYAADGGESGRVTFQSGRLPEMFKWMAIPISDAVPSGRLATADISGSVRMTGDSWALSDIQGSVDTSTIMASIAGTTAPFSVGAAKVNVDKLNLDAYWPFPSFDNTSTNADERSALLPSELGLPDMELEININALQWQHRAFFDLSAVMLASDNRLSLRQFRVQNDGGTIKAQANLQGGRATTAPDAGAAGGDAEIEGSVDFQNWRYPLVRAFLPENVALLDAFSDKGPITGAISFNGPVSALQTRLDVRAAGNSADITGTLGALDPVSVDLQGTFNHGNILSLLATLPGVNLPANLPAGTLPATLNISVGGKSDDLTFRTSGQLAGHQLDLSGTYAPAQSTVDFSMNMPSGISARIQEVAGDYAQLLNTAAPSRIRFSAVRREDSISIKNVDISNGAARISGDVTVEGQLVEGAVVLNNIDADRVLQNLKLNEGESDLNYSGALAMNISNLTLFGQRLDAPGGRFDVRETGATFILGPEAQLNGQPVSGTVNLASAAASTLQFTSASIDAGKLLTAMNLTSSVTGMITTNVDLSTTGNTARDMLTSLSGDVTFNGGAGSLYFMAVPKIIEALRSSDSKTGFLTVIGGLLRSGQTSFANLEGALRFDGGVALIDQIVASGEWGQFSVGGQANIADDILDLKGSLDLAQPQDTPAIPVAYQGSLTSPTTNWASAALERFALAGIQRRLRNQIFGEFDRAQSADTSAAPESPGSAVVGAAFGLLSRLREAQEAKKKEATEKEGGEAAKTGGSN